MANRIFAAYSAHKLKEMSVKLVRLEVNFCYGYDYLSFDDPDFGFGEDLVSLEDASLQS